MKKLLLLTSAVIALGGLASCSDDNVASIDPVSTQAEENTPISFGTYLGNEKSTRSGQTGSMTTKTLQNGEGFGVYAYYTETKKFQEAWEAAEKTTGGILTPNFMSNEQVKYTDGAWKSTTPKYWPNPTNVSADVTSPQFVTFLAYAPYVKNFEGTDDTNSGIVSRGTTGTESGIGQHIAVSKRSDRYIVWKRNRSEDANIKGDVDLLWGTAGNNGAPIDITADDADQGWDKENTKLSNSGQSFTNIPSNADEAQRYAANNTSINSDLTKMKVGGVVQFKFKHALGAFGGYANGSKTSMANGILIDYYNDVNSSSNNDKLSSDTRVFVNWIAIEFMSNDLVTEDDGRQYYNLIPDRGYFDLVTGQWDPDFRPDDYTSDASGAGRVKTIYYFSPTGGEPDEGTDNDGYKKYLTKYGNRNSNYYLVCKKLDGHLWGRISATSGINDYATNNKWFASGNNTGWANGIVTGVTNVSRSIYAEEDDPIYFIPGTKLTAKVVVNYDIVTPDGKITKKCAIAHQEMAKQGNFTQRIFMNNLYALYVHLGMTSIKLEAKVERMGTGDASDDPDNKWQPTTTEIVDADISPNDLP